MRYVKAALVAGLLTTGSSLNAAVITFDFTFFETTGEQLGSGFVSFENYSGSGSSIKSFRSVSEYSWRFDIESLGITIGSFQGGSITLGAIQSQGFVISGDQEPTSSLNFFDRTGDGIFSSSGDSMELTGIRFSHLSNEASFIVDGEVVANGYFSTAENILITNPIPEPGTVILVGIGSLSLLVRRRHES